MEKNKQVLIFGGSGYVGQALTSHLESKGFVVSWATRKINPSRRVRQVVYDWKSETIESGALSGVGSIINLSGANIGAHRWTKKYRQEIHESRVGVANFIAHLLQNEPHQVKSYIGMSAVGIYGALTDGRIHEEGDLPGNDFLAQVCVDWEKAHDKVQQEELRSVIIRTAVVFNKGSEAYNRLVAPIRLGFGAALGSGKQLFPWVHVKDLCGLIEKALMDEAMHGVYNAAAPDQPSNKEVMQLVATSIKLRIWLPNIPTVVLRILLGGIADTLVNGNAVSPKRLLDAGYQFHYVDLSQVLQEALDKE